MSKIPRKGLGEDFIQQGEEVKGTNWQILAFHQSARRSKKQRTDGYTNLTSATLFQMESVLTQSDHWK